MKITVEARNYVLVITRGKMKKREKNKRKGIAGGGEKYQQKQWQNNQHPKDM